MILASETTAATAAAAAAAAEAAAATAARSASTDAAAAQDRFLKLLVAQLSNQDPMNPMDNAQMTSQMAQISTVSGIEQVNDTLKSLAAQTASMQILQSGSLVGRDVLVAGSKLVPDQGVAGGAVDLDGRADAVKIEILSAGRVIDSFDLGAKEAGRHMFTWDAAQYPGAIEPSFRVTATLDGKSVAAAPLVRDRVASVRSDNGSMQVQLGGLGSVAYDAVRAIL